MARADGLSPPVGRPPRGVGLLLCGLLSAAGHAALLLGATLPDAGATGHGARVVRSPRADPTTAAIELQPAPAPASPAVTPATAANAPRPDLVAAPEAGPTAAASPVQPESRPPDQALAVDAPPPIAHAQAEPDADDRYLPRSALDVGPVSTVPVDLPYPADAPAGRFEGVLTLFIDADGRVRRVRHDSGNLPAQLADEARQAFLAARFHPGVKDGRAVGSRLRVGVSYTVDAPRADPASAATSASSAASGPH